MAREIGAFVQYQKVVCSDGEVTMIHSPSVTKIIGSTRLTMGGPVDPPQGTERIVLAEDDPGVRKATMLILEDLGYDVQAYPSGPDVLDALAKDDRPIELLLTDFDMPGLNGYELARRLLALRPDARVLLTSGSPEESIVPRVKPADWPPFIPKPYTCRSLGQKLREVLDESTAAH